MVMMMMMMMTTTMEVMKTVVRSYPGVEENDNDFGGGFGEDNVEFDRDNDNYKNSNCDDDGVNN